MKSILYLAAYVIFLLHVETAQALEEDSKVQTYRIGYFDSPPLSFKRQPQHPPKGFAIDLLNEVASLNHFQIDWYYGNFPDILQMMKNQ